MKLTLKTEHLAALTDESLSDVVGGMYSAVGYTCPALRCVTGTNTNTMITCPTGCDLRTESVVCY